MTAPLVSHQCNVPMAAISPLLPRARNLLSNCWCCRLTVKHVWRKPSARAPGFLENLRRSAHGAPLLNEVIKPRAEVRDKEKP